MRAALKRTAPPPPDSVETLLARARAIAGRNLGELAADAAIDLPPDTRRDKGIVGELLECALGADAGGADAPDFAGLGVELKTLPVGRDGRPKQSTFVCTIRLDDAGDTRWRDSRVYRKLARVLWVPVEAEPDIPLSARRVGRALLWSPSPDQEAALQADWEELMALFGAGAHDQITAHLGQHLQVRPKAARASIMANARDEHGAPIRTAPRGFYLRPTFTAALLAAKSPPSS